MPMHDWTQVEAGIFHAFHHEWISEISQALTPRFSRGTGIPRLRLTIVGGVKRLV